MINLEEVSLNDLLQFELHSEMHYVEATIELVINFVNSCALFDVTDSMWVCIDGRKVRVIYISSIVWSKCLEDLRNSVIFVDYINATTHDFAKFTPVIKTSQISDGNAEYDVRKVWEQFVEEGER